MYLDSRVNFCQEGPKTPSGDFSFESTPNLLDTAVVDIHFKNPITRGRYVLRIF